MTVLIIEDEAPAFRRLQKSLEEIDPEIEIVDVLDSVEETVHWVSHHQLPDLIFMDIQLSDGLSFEIFDRVNISRPVIFTTAYDEYTLRAFRVNSIDYLLKPLKKEELQRSLKKFHELRGQFAQNPINIAEVVKQIHIGGQQYKDRYLLRHADKLISIETEHIAFFKTKNGVVHLTTQSNKTFLMDLSLDELMTQLDPKQFYRANRQFIINYRSVQMVERYSKGKLLIYCSPEAPEQIIVSAEKATDFKSWLGD